MAIPSLAYLSDYIFLRKFILLLLEVSVVLGFVFASFIQVYPSTIMSSKIMDEPYIQAVIFT